MAVKSSRSVFLVLKALASASGPVGAGELSKKLDLPVSTTMRALATLEAADYAERYQSSARYVIGNAARTLAFAFLAQFPLRDLALPYLQRITLESSHTSSIFFRLGWFAVRLMAVPGLGMIEPNAPVGEARPLTSGGPSLAILAFLPEGEQAAAIARGGVAVSERDVLRLCKKVRADGMILAPSSLGAGAVDLAVPLFDTRDQVVASVAIEGVPEGQSEALVAADSAVSQIIRDFVEQARRETSAWEFSYEHVDPDMIAL